MTSFLDLPGELRNNIYEDILNSIFLHKPQSPWASLPKVHTFLSLLLCNKQVNEEVQSLFDAQYSTKATIYCDDIATLRRYHWEHQWCPTIRNARFSIRKIRPDVDGHTGWKYELEGLITAQPGFKYDEWMYYLDFYRTEPKRQNYILHTIPTHSIRPEWVAEERGFRRLEYGDARECIEGGQPCRGFKTLEYPILQNGCQITAYSWITRSHGKHSTESGSMVLEGRLRDLVIH